MTITVRTSNPTIWFNLPGNIPSYIHYCCQRQTHLTLVKLLQTVALVAPIIEEPGLNLSWDLAILTEGFMVLASPTQKLSGECPNLVMSTSSHYFPSQDCHTILSTDSINNKP
jgi:hypothetical protein